MFLILVVVLGVAPSIVLTGAPAQEGAAAETSAGIMSLVTVQVYDWTTLANAVSGIAPGVPTTIELINSIPAEGHPAITISGGVDITLTSAGGPHTLFQETAGERHFVINNGTLRLRNVTLSGDLAVTDNHGGVEFSTGSSVRQLFLETGGIIENNRAGQGGGVFMRGVNASTTINGGIIRNNRSASTGGGISATSNSTLIMNAGAIEGNEANTSGGGVHVAQSTFNIIDGNICGNTGNSGGGIFISAATAAVNMDGGRIENNTSTGYGGGISVTASSRLTMTGGIIYNNNAASGGGGVNLLNPTGASIVSRFYMDGGRIENNTAGTNGGGVMAWGGAAFTMADGIIYDNEANNGGGIHVQSGAGVNTVFTMECGIIYGNYAIGAGTNNGGGGVNIAGGTFIMENGIIENNFAVSNGGGVRRGAEANAFFIMSGGTISNNTAQRGGGLFSQGEAYSDPVAATAYPRITIGSEAIFSGNRAITGAFRAINIEAIRNQVETTHATLFGHPINNFDINFSGAQAVYSLTITYISTASGTFNNAPYNERIESITIADIVVFPVFTQLVPAVTAVPGYRFIGWAQYGAPNNTLLSADDIYALSIIDNITFIAQYEKYHTVNFMWNYPRPYPASPIYHETTVDDGDTLTLPANPQRENFDFQGWYLDSQGTIPFDPAVPIDGNKNLYARWTPVNRTVTFLWNYTPRQNPVYYETTIAHGGLITSPTNPIRNEFVFQGWYTNAAGTAPFSFNTPIVTDIYLYARWTPAPPQNGNGDDNGNGDYTPYVPQQPPIQPPPQPDPEPPILLPYVPVPDPTPQDYIPLTPYHIAYIIGFEDGYVRPGNNITRAEVATIFFRLMCDDYRAYIWSQQNPFADVQLNNWFNNAVSTLANADLILGYPDGYFRPNQAMTRAEFSALVVRVMGYRHVTDIQHNAFTDISGHWAESYIHVAHLLGWVQGYGDGTFRPNQFITRAEVVALVNRALGRLPENTGDLLESMITWPDNVNVNAWYYLYIQEATNSHTHVMKDDGIHEAWLYLLPPREWSRLERPYSTPHF